MDPAGGHPGPQPARPERPAHRVSQTPGARPDALEAMRREILETAGDAVLSLGGGGHRLRVGLWADREAEARSLQERFGDAVELTVGYLRYPERVLPDRLATALAHTVEPDRTLVPDRIGVTIAGTATVRSGQHRTLTLRLANDGSSRFTVKTSGQIIAVVVDPATGRCVGGFEGAVTLPLVLFTADPGTSTDIPLLVGTASREPDLGYAVPLGRWALEAVLDTDSGSVRTPPLPLEIVA
jgi:hypothetical protein